MFRKSILASAALLGMAGAARAEALPASDFTGQVPASAGNVVGGGEARLIGGGSNAVIVRTESGPAQPGRAARLFGNGGGAEVYYLEPVPQGARGRDAWLLGGGDNAVIVYGDTLAAPQG